MRARACTILGMWAILIAAPVWAAGGRYGTDYPVCMEALDAGGGTHIDCLYTSIEQCRQGTVGTSGTCFNNPSYVPRPAEAAPAEAEPQPATNPKKNAGRYGTDYPVCMEALDAGGGTHIDCLYTSIEQCRQGAVGTPGTCFNNPSYMPPPPEPASVQTESAPPAKPGKPAKPAKPAKSAKSLQSPPLPQTR
jgi:Protein of unknown function (DUF3551)